jgi:hypothetical protein
MRTKILMLALVLALLLAVVGAALATSATERPREVLSGGVSDSASGGIALQASLGQPVVGVVASGGGDVRLGQGFWHGGRYRVYLPLVQR